MCCNKLKLILPDVKDVCISNSTVAQENGKKITFKSCKSDDICRLKVDNCHLSSDSHKKCDYLFFICSKNEMHFVELKGTDVETACQQIVKTYDIIHSDLSKNCCKVIPNYKAHLVSSSVPNATEIKFRKLQEKILKEKSLLIKKYHKQHTI